MSGKPRTSEVEVGGKKDISGIPSYGTIAIGQADRPTDTQSQTGRQTTREGQSTKCTGRQDGTQGDTFLFKGPARSPLECVPLTLIRCQKISFPFGVVAGRCRERGREGEGEGEDTNETGDGRMDGWIGSVINQSAEGIYSSNLFCVYLT